METKLEMVSSGKRINSDFIALFLSSGLDGTVTNMTQVYADDQLYENVLEKVKSDQRVIELL